MRLTSSACHEALDAGGTHYAVVLPGEAPTVDQPVRVQRLGGVRFVIPWSRDQTSDPHAIWDCRLAVALLPLAQWLAQQGVTEVHYFSVLRQGAMAHKKPRSQHNRGLALDLLGVVIADGRDTPRLDVEDHYPKGRLPRCPRGVARFRGMGASARLYANLVCMAYERRSVHTLLTPDYDKAHENHLHLDVKAGMRAPADPFVSLTGNKKR